MRSSMNLGFFGPPQILLWHSVTHRCVAQHCFILIEEIYWHCLPVFIFYPKTKKVLLLLYIFKEKKFF